MAKKRNTKQKHKSQDQHASPRTPRSPTSNIQRNTSQASNERTSSSSRVQSTPSSKSRLSQQSKKNLNKPKKRRTTQMLVGHKIFRITTKVLREIRHYQMTTQTLIPKLPFSRLIREIIAQFAPAGGRIQHAALEALQEASETYLTQFFEDCYACSLHARRCTLTPRDMGLVQYLRHSNL